MPKAKKLPSGSWRVLAYVGRDEEGKRKYKSFTDPDKKEAEYAAAEYILKHKKGNIAESFTFQEATDKYLADKINVLSPASIRGYRIMQRNAFSLLLPSQLGEMSNSNLIQKQMDKNAKKYAAKSIRNQIKFISAVMKYFGCSFEKVSLKPLDGHGIQVPTKKEAEKIMVLLRSSPEIECQALLALTCSLRQSEIAGLTVDNIDGSTVHIHGACVPDENNHWVFKETNKSASGTRDINMPNYLRDKVAALCKKKGAGRLFELTPIQVLYRFKKLLLGNGMPPYTIHSLRHCFAAIMHAQNVPDKYVMEMGGWASESVLKKIYQYTFQDEVQKAKKEANQYFDKTLFSKDATQNATRSKKYSASKQDNK